MRKIDIIRRAHQRLQGKVTMPVIQRCSEAFIAEALHALCSGDVDHLELRKLFVLDVVPLKAKQNVMPDGKVIDLPRRGKLKLRLHDRYQQLLNARMLNV